MTASAEQIGDSSQVSPAADAVQAGGLNSATVREYRTVDKSAWPGGPWHGEPDKRQWKDATTGLDCLLVRGPHGGLCGYVGVRPDHPWHGIGYGQAAPVSPALAASLIGDYANLYADEIAAGMVSPDAMMTVHGGLTFASGCGHGPDPATGICHIPAPGEPDDVWWFGFDCAHCDDYVPGHSRRFDPPLFGEVYREAAYVTEQCAGLAAQLALVAA